MGQRTHKHTATPKTGVPFRVLRLLNKGILFNFRNRLRRRKCQDNLFLDSERKTAGQASCKSWQMGESEERNSSLSELGSKAAMLSNESRQTAARQQGRGTWEREGKNPEYQENIPGLMEKEENGGVGRSSTEGRSTLATYIISLSRDSFLPEP